MGRKIGATSEAVQQQLGVDQPDFGYLFDDMDVSDHDRSRCGRCCSRGWRPRWRSGWAADVNPPTRPTSPRAVREAVEVALPALEIVDSRIDQWDIKFTDTVADNASSGLYVVGSEGVPLDELEPRDVEMWLTINGEVRSSGNGAACLGDPLEALRGWPCSATGSATRSGPARSCCPERWARSCRSPRVTAWRRPSAGSTPLSATFVD